MKLFVVTLGALLLAAPVFSQEQKPQVHEALMFSLHEQRAQVEQKMGHPSTVASDGDFESWQYQIGIEDHHEYSHLLLFRHSTGELISFTRNYEPSQNVDELFPEPETKVFQYPDARQPVMVFRVRRIKDGRVVVAIGSAHKGEPAAQVMTIQDAELKHFNSWLWERLQASK